MARNVVVDQAKCIGCGLCVTTCPAIFELDENGKSRVKDGADVEKSTCTEEAADNCPANAITVTNVDKSQSAH